jgi:putative DNA primase/helicase
VNVDAIPAELRDLPRWVVWRWGELDPKTGKRKKPPFCPADLRRHASSTKSETWATFAQAIAIVEAGKADGVGLALEPPYVGIDLDDALPEIEQHAVMAALDSYSERSPSGEGHHVVIRASLNGHGRHPQGIGVFQVDRLFYFTGAHVHGTPTTIEERQAELERVLDQYLPKQPPARASRPAQPVSLNDQELLEKAGRADNGPKFERLWNGDTSGYDNDESRADLALCDLLAFWTGRDPDRIDRLFRSSGLMRDKWERDDYRERTIETAIAGCRNTYKAETGRRNFVSAKDFAARGEGDSEERSSESYVVGTPISEPPSLVVSEETRRAESVSDPGNLSGSERPFAMPIREFIALEREHREPLLADSSGRATIGRNSLTLAGALGGHGKTTFAIDLFLHLAAGVDYPPWTVPKPVAVLLVENEGPEELFADKLEARLVNFPHELKAKLDVCTFDWGGFSLAEDAHRERLTREIKDEGYELVFGDPLDSLGIDGVGSPEDTRKFLALMKETGLNKTVAWWLNTHPRKEETKEALNEIAGAWGGKPDSVFLLRLLEDDRTRVRQPKLRWAKRGKGPTLLYAFDPNTEAFTFIGEESEDERDYVAEVRKLLADGEWRLVKEIAAPSPAGIGANVDIVKKVLKEHPDEFESRTGEAAKALGRRADATLWGLAIADDEEEAA